MFSVWYQGCHLELEVFLIYTDRWQFYLALLNLLVVVALAGTLYVLGWHPVIVWHAWLARCRFWHPLLSFVGTLSLDRTLLLAGSLVVGGTLSIFGWHVVCRWLVFWW